jgi:ElaB/YqjD/DUF883 family membrane-anchored ribosome-binding protein
MSHDPEHIEEKIETTRARLSQNLDELGDRMSPGNLVDEALRYFDTGPKDFAGSLGGQVKQNPVAALMTAAGVAWMAFGQGRDPARRYMEHDSWRGDDRDDDWDDDRDHGRFDVASHGDSDSDITPHHVGTSDLHRSRPSRTWSYDDVQRTYGDTYEMSSDDYEMHRSSIGTYDAIVDARSTFHRDAGETDSAYYRRLDDTYARTLHIEREDGEDDETYRARIRAAVDTASDKAREAREALSQTARRARNRMREMGYKAKHRAGELRDDASRRAWEFSDEAAYRARMAKHRTAEFHEENPLVTGAIAMAVGALAGSLFPVTRQERDALAPVADDLIERGATLAEQGAEHAEALAEQGTRTVEQYAGKIEEKAEDYREEPVLRTGTGA